MADMRDRLIELMAVFCDMKEKRCVGCDEGKYYTPKCKAERFGKVADHLIANGVILPPCKVGDVVYKIGTYPWASECGECEHFMPGGFGDPCECLKTDDGRKAPECRTIVEYKAELRDILSAIGWGEFGKTVFLTREEAEKALKEREQV